MGIDQAMVAIGNVFDVALERLRDDVRRARGGRGRGRSCRRSYAAHQAHVRRMVELLREEIAQARARSSTRAVARRRSGSSSGRRCSARRRTTSGRASTATATARLELLENRVAPLAMDDAFTFLRYVGTDVDAFFRAFPLAEVVKGERIPHRPARRARREAVRRGVAEAQERAAPRSDQGRARPAREADRGGRGAAALGPREPRRDPRDPPAARSRARRARSRGCSVRRSARPRARGSSRSSPGSSRRPTRPSTGATRCSTTSSRRACACTASTSATRSPSRRPRRAATSAP